MKLVKQKVYLQSGGSRYYYYQEIQGKKKRISEDKYKSIKRGGGDYDYLEPYDLFTLQENIKKILNNNEINNDEKFRLLSSYDYDRLIVSRLPSLKTKVIKNINDTIRNNKNVQDLFKVYLCLKMFKGIYGNNKSKKPLIDGFENYLKEKEASLGINENKKKDYYFQFTEKTGMEVPFNIRHTLSYNGIHSQEDV